MKKVTKFPLILISLMLVTGLILYPELPAKIPTHWGASGKVDSWADKSLPVVFATPLASLGVYILFLLLPFIDPKRRNFEKFGRTYNILINIAVAFFTVPFILMIATSFDKSFSGSKSQTIFMAATSLLLIGVGNYLGKVKQNWLVGLRTPWTLTDETVWNKSNRFSGKLMVSVGLIGLAGIFLPFAYKGIVFVALLFLAVVVSVAYSLLLFKKNKNS